MRSYGNSYPNARAESRRLTEANSGGDRHKISEAIAANSLRRSLECGEQTNVPREAPNQPTA